jgi:hypothetical protein
MLSDLQRRKFTRLFNVQDLDRDGYLEENDFEGFAANIAKAFHHQAGDSTYEMLQQAYRNQWEELEQHTDEHRENKISLDEWMEYHDRMLNSPDLLSQHIREVQEGFYQLCELLDPGKGDVTTLFRYQMFCKGYNLDPQDAEKWFQRMDADKDGVLSKAEMYETVKEFFESSDSQAPGNWLVGPY